MALHTVLYRSSIALSTNDAAVTFQPFGFDVISNNQWLPPRDMQLLFAYCFGTGMNNPSILTPWLQQTQRLTLEPWNIDTTVINDGNTVLKIDSPVQFKRTENVNVLSSNTNAGAQTHNVILGFGDGNYNDYYPGQKIRARFTGTSTLVAGGWARANLVAVDALPYKRFAVTGFRAFSATGILGRLLFPTALPNGMTFEPGFPMTTGATLRLAYDLYKPQFGVLGIFDNQTLPSLEVFATAADTAQLVVMDLIVLA